jgi:hypothetical protein
VFERRSRPLAAASATAHAFLAGDARHAAELARRAAAATRAVGLENAARAFEEHAETRDPRCLIDRGLLASQLDTARSMPSYVPDRPPEPERVAERLSLPDDAPVPESLSPDALEDDEDIETSVPNTFRVSSAIGTEGAGSNGSGDGSEPPLSAVAALRTGDVAAVQRLAVHLRGAEGRGGLADRLEAMVHLARGETGNALRRLREAAEAAKRENSAEQCRASLALGVALAAANRADEALFAALEGLARARERADKRGERACARFLAQLARGAGHPEVAAAWQALAQL